MKNYLLAVLVCFLALPVLHSCGDDDNTDDNTNTDVCATCKMMYIDGSSQSQDNCEGQYCNLDFDFINSNTDFDSSAVLLNQCGTGWSGFPYDTVWYVCTIIE